LGVTSGVSSGREFHGLSSVSGPLIAIKGVSGVGFGERAEVVGEDGRRREGQVLEINGDLAIVQVFEGTENLSTGGTRVRFVGEPLRIPVAEEMLGRIFNYLGEPLDGGPKIIAKDRRSVYGVPVNPSARQYPRDYIETGVSAIDGMNTLVRGQKLPIFSGAGLPHNMLAAQIARQAAIRGRETRFSIVFAAMGVKMDTAEFFRRSLEESGALTRSVMFFNLAHDPSIERLITPRSALTAAEYLAFDMGMDVLVILIDITNYAESLREVASARGEVPSRKGYPGYLYSDLASIFERAGRIEGKDGSITQIPILTMPNDDIDHPVPDLTGYITEGQIVLSRELDHKGIYPPVDILPSLSRLMKDGIGEGMTRSDHPNLASQVYAAYSRVQTVRSLVSVVGEEGLSRTDTQYLEFGDAFERRLVNQWYNERRSLDVTLDLAWELLSYLPPEELNRVSEDQIRQHYHYGNGKAGRKDAERENGTNPE